MLGSICNFFHLGKHSKFLQAITELIHTVTKIAHANGTWVPSFHRWLFSKYNHKSHLIRTPGYLIRFPNYQNTNVPQTSCKSEAKKKKDWQACCLILSLPAAALWWADSWAWRTVTGDKVMGSPVHPARGQRQTRQPHFWSNRALTDSCRWHVFSWTSSSLKTQCLQNAFWIHIHSFRGKILAHFYVFTSGINTQETALQELVRQTQTHLLSLLHYMVISK